MHSSGENSRKCKNDSDKRGGYRKFDEASSRMRESLIKSCAERVIDHAASNGGRCRLVGFVKELVDELNQRAPVESRKRMKLRELISSAKVINSYTPTGADMRPTF